VGGGSYCIGAFEAARKHWEQNLALYEAHRPAAHISLYDSDFGVFSRCWASHAMWHLGYPDQALTISRQALALARELEHPYSLALALDYAAMLHQFRREHDTVQHKVEAALALCTAHGFAYYRAWGMALCGWV
jgi:predicted ATPase